MRRAIYRWRRRHRRDFRAAWWRRGADAVRRSRALGAWGLVQIVAIC